MTTYGNSLYVKRLKYMTTWVPTAKVLVASWKKQFNPIIKGMVFMESVIVLSFCY